MNKITFTNKTLTRLKSSTSPYFIRDSSLKGFGVKVNPSGTIKSVAEVWYGGRSNKRPHYVPVTLGVLDKATNSSAYIFPSPVYKDQPIQTERPTLKRLSNLTSGGLT